MTRFAAPPLMSCCLLALVLQAASAGAQAPASGDAARSPRREVRGQLGASINNAGLQSSIDLVWTRPLSDSASPIFSGAHVSAGVSHAVTPAQARLGAWIEYSPLSIFDLRVGADPQAYFGTFHSLMSFDAYTDSFDKDARKSRGEASAGTAVRVYAAPTIKAKAGRLVASAGAEFEWWRSSADGAFFYEPTRDTLLRSRGDGMMTATTVVLYQQARGDGGTLSAGGLHNLAYVYDAPGNRIQRVGAIAIREFGVRRFRLPNPRVTGVVAYYLDDPSKEGQLYAAVAVGFRK
jgi:hypothetical protein